MKHSSVGANPNATVLTNLQAASPSFKDALTDTLPSALKSELSSRLDATVQQAADAELAKFFDANRDYDVATAFCHPAEKR